MPLLGAGINPAACRSLTNSIVITIADEEDVQLNVTVLLIILSVMVRMLSLLFQLLLVQTMSLN